MTINTDDFERAVDHLDLHSFPTRRSSDLTVPHVQANRLSGDPRQLVQRASTKCSERTILPEQDRKSTRLNSSHRCISYAVFCLKKKTAKAFNEARLYLELSKLGRMQLPPP